MWNNSPKPSAAFLPGPFKRWQIGKAAPTVSLGAEGQAGKAPWAPRAQGIHMNLWPQEVLAVQAKPYVSGGVRKWPWLPPAPGTG